MSNEHWSCLFPSQWQNYVITLHFIRLVILKINFYTEEGGATRVGSVCDITSALGAPFRSSRAVLFFHFRTPRAGPLLVISVLLLRVSPQTASSSLHLNRVHPALQEKTNKQNTARICGSFTAGFYSFAPRLRFLSRFVCKLYLRTPPKWRTRTSTSRSSWRKETAWTRPSCTPWNFYLQVNVIVYLKTIHMYIFV